MGRIGEVRRCWKDRIEEVCVYVCVCGGGGGGEGKL